VPTLISDDQARIEILQLLYKRQTESPNTAGLDRAIIQAVIKLSEEQLESNMLYLQEKALITFSKRAGSKWVFAEITVEGIKAITGEVKFENSIQESFPENYPEYVAEVFKQARYQIRETRLPNSTKEKLEKQLKALEAELQKVKKTDLGKIQKIYNELNENPYGITPAISKVVLTTIKTTLNLQ
jgi:hypothetical protein